MKVLLVGPDPRWFEGRLVLKSIQRVFESLSASLASQCELIRSWEQEVSPSLLSRVHAIVGTYEALKLRHRFGLDVPVLVVTLGDMPQGGLRLWAYQGLLRAYDGLSFSCSSDLAIFNRLVERYNLLVEIVPFSVDCDLFHRHPVDRKQLRRKWGLPSDQGKCLLYVGRISLQKNLHMLIRILEEVVQRTNAFLCIVGVPDQTPLEEFGSGVEDYFHRLQEGIRQKGLTDRVRFLGFLDGEALVELYSLSDVLVNPTLHHDENFGFAQAEALSCGLPVVGSKWGGLKDVVLHGETGFLMETILTDRGPRLEWRSGVQYILHLLSNGPLWREMSRRCRARALSKFSREAVGRTLRRMLEEMVSRKERGGPDRFPAVQMRKEVLDYIMSRISPDEDGRLRYQASQVDDSEEARWFYRLRMEPYASMTISEAEDVEGSTKPYQAIELSIYSHEGYAEVTDPLWPGKVYLDRAALAFLIRADGKKTLHEICAEVGISEGRGRKMFRRLLREGLILSAKEEGRCIPSLMREREPGST